MIEHLADLAKRAQARNIFAFSGFLSPDEQAKLLEKKRELSPFTLFGGTIGTERNMARFGSVQALGYEAPFPIVCVKIEPVNPRFAEKLTHRDYLGSIMGLGIERSGVGDIIARQTEAYLFCTEKMAPFLTENLTKIRHTDVKLTVCDTVPEGSLYETRPVRLTLSSLRIDCAASAAVRLSRSRIAELMKEKKVFLNSAVCEKPDALLAPGDTFSVRGFGKFRLVEVTGQSKKGKLVTQLEEFI